MKTCTRCKEHKTHDCFTKDKQTKDGLRAWCRECRAEYDRARKQSIGHAAWRDQHRESRRKYDTSDRGRARARDANQQSRKRHKDRVAARSASYKQAKVEGLCTRCGKRPAEQRHHNDYSKALDVELLCFRCHRSEHIGEMA
jgi:hypothetical protein